RAPRSPKRRAEQDRTERNPCESEPPVERRPVDVTTMRTTPQRTPTTAPSLDVAKLNGGVVLLDSAMRPARKPRNREHHGRPGGLATGRLGPQQSNQRC